MIEPVPAELLVAVAKVAPVSSVIARVKAFAVIPTPTSKVAPDLTVTTPGSVVPARSCVEPRMPRVPAAMVTLPSVMVGPLIPI